MALRSDHPNGQLGYELARAVQLSLEEEWQGAEYHLERALSVVSARLFEALPARNEQVQGSAA